jgi:hypothetical protein
MGFNWLLQKEFLKVEPQIIIARNSSEITATLEKYFLI